MLIDSRQVPAWNTPISSKWKSWEVHHTVKCNYTTQSDAPVKPDTHPKGGPVSLGRNSTTSFLTTTTLIYTIEAGITAAAGTRLALQLLVIQRCRFHSFQVQDMSALYCYFLSLPLSVRSGQFARLLPSLDVVAMSWAPSPESNPNSPLPVTARVGQYPTIGSW